MSYTIGVTPISNIDAETGSIIKSHLNFTVQRSDSSYVQVYNKLVKKTYALLATSISIIDHELILSNERHAIMFIKEDEWSANSF